MFSAAQLGHVPELPANILAEPSPQGPKIWEVRRVLGDATLSSRERMRVRGQLGVSFARLAKDWNIDAFLCLTSVSAALLTRQAGINITPAGLRFEIEGETCQAYHLKVDAKRLRRSRAA